MESASTVHDVPPKQNTGRWKFRPGQQAFIDYVKSNTSRPTYVGRFPTGYGKTEIIAAAYDALRSAGRGNRLLVVVPTATQEEQYAKEFAKKAKRMGLHVRAVICADRTERTLKYHRRNEAEVFVTTVQRMEISLGDKSQENNWLKDLLSTGQWIGAADEYHHYAQDNTWGAAIKAAGIAQWIAVSATPTRKVGLTVFGAPAISVTYEEAFNEDPPAVKDVHIKVREYKVSVQDGYGDIQSLSAADLISETELEGIDKWESRRQLRYLPKYCAPILAHAVEELNALAVRLPVAARPQMLVYAHSCAHARSLCEILRSVALGWTVDWAGVGPNGRDDTPDVLAKFLDEVDDAGRVTTPHTIDCLVQVNVAGEGFDSRPVCVIVDLSLTGMSPQKLQQYGRGTRTFHDRALTVFVPNDSPMAKYAPLMRGVFDCELDAHIPPEQPGPDGGDGGLPPPLPISEVIDALLIGCFDYVPSKDEVMWTAAEISDQLSRREGRLVSLDVEENDADFEMVRDAIIATQKRLQQQNSESSRLAFWQDRVQRGMSAVVSDFIRVTIKGSVDKSIPGDVMKRIHSKWKRENCKHDAMTAEEFAQKYRWLCRIQADIREGRVPAWMQA